MSEGQEKQVEQLGMSSRRGFIKWALGLSVVSTAGGVLVPVFGYMSPPGRKGPGYQGPTVRPQRFAGTDRQVRGLLMSVLRGSAAPVGKPDLDTVWRDDVQRERALDSLVVDGLVDPLPDGRYALPG